MNQKKNPVDDQLRKGGCPHCGGRTDHNPIHDAIYCPNCDRWLESRCKNPYCEYCGKRPEKPSQAPF